MLAKVPGVSEKRLQRFITAIRADIVELATDAYNGASWVADWRVLSVDDLGRPVAMEFISATGESDEPRQTHWGMRAWGRWADWAKHGPEKVDEIGEATAKAASGTWDAEIELGWVNRWAIGGPDVGSIHQEYGQDFFRGGNLDGVAASVTIPIRIKARVWYRKTDQAIAFQWSWKAGSDD